MQFSAITLALAFGSASAFMGQPLNTRSARSAAVKMTTQEELAELAESNRDALGAGLGKTTAPPACLLPRALPPPATTHKHVHVRCTTAWLTD